MRSGVLLGVGDVLMEGRSFFRGRRLIGTVITQMTRSSIMLGGSVNVPRKTFTVILGILRMIRISVF